MKLQQISIGIHNNSVLKIQWLHLWQFTVSHGHVTEFYIFVKNQHFKFLAKPSYSEQLACLMTAKKVTELDQSHEIPILKAP